MALVFNHTVSNRILLATLDRKWKRQRVSDGHLVYIANANKATIELLVNGMKKTVKRQFTKGARIFVVDGTFHFPPHIRL